MRGQNLKEILQMSRDEKADKQQSDAGNGPSSVPQEPPVSPASHSPTVNTHQHGAGSEEHHGGEKLGTFLGGLIPVVISVLFHLGLLLIMLFIVFLAEVEVDTEKIEIADDAFSEDPGARLSPSRNISKSASQTKSKTRKHTRSKAINTGAGKTSKAVSVMGMGGAVGDSAADMGLPVSSSGGSAFFGTKSGGNMRNIVYVIDRSGSMVAYFSDVRNEICRSLARLNGDKQDYHVILFAEGKPLEKNPKRLTPAIRQNVRETARWLEDVTCGGDTKAIPALERAFAVLKGRKGGSLIYLLTDGVFKDIDGNAAVLAYIRSKNKNKKVHVNTFLYGTRPKRAVEVMEKIAKQNSGRYRFVEDQE
jgi:hypothetical protein